jgi:hypothetical protein
MSSKNAISESDRSEEEVGSWTYLVIDSKGIRSHSDASYSKETKTESKVAQGVIVEVDRRRKCGWTTFLGLKGPGPSKEWLFDVSPKDKKVRMIEVEVSMGDWKYESCDFVRIPILSCPLVGGHSQTSTTSLQTKEAVSITKRARPVSGKGTFLKLADGRGWVLDFADGSRVMQRFNPEGCDDVSEPSTSSSNISVALSESDLGPSEYGSWEYVVLDSRGMTLRSRPTYDEDAKTQRRIYEGEVLVVKERRMGDGITFLHIDSPQGWVFDRNPGKNSKLRMMEANVETGSWHYTVTAASGIALRTRCSFSDSTKCGEGPLKGSLIEVCERLKVGDTTFLKLKDCGHWIFDSKHGRKLLSGPADVQEHSPCWKATVKEACGVYMWKAPTTQKWAQTKMKLLQHAQVEVQKTIGVEFDVWGFIAKPGSNMEGWVRLRDLTLEDASPASCGLRSCASQPCPQGLSKQMYFEDQPMQNFVGSQPSDFMDTLLHASLCSNEEAKSKEQPPAASMPLLMANA